MGISAVLRAILTIFCFSCMVGGGIRRLRNAVRLQIRPPAPVRINRGGATESDPRPWNPRKSGIMELLLKTSLPGLPPALERVFPPSARGAEAAVASGKFGNRDMASSSSRWESASNEELLGAVSHSGDTAAFAQLFERYSTRIYQTGMKLTRNEQLSRDLVQETMITVWQKATQFDLDRGSADNWIFTVTRNRCFDLLRKVKRQPVCVSADDIWPAGGESGPAPELDDTAEQSALLSRVGELLERLPSAQQAVIKEIYVLDFTHEEAARRLDIPLGTLKSRLRLGLDKLKYLAGVEE